MRGTFLGHTRDCNRLGSILGSFWETTIWGVGPCGGVRTGDTLEVSGRL